MLGIDTKARPKFKAATDDKLVAKFCNSVLYHQWYTFKLSLVKLLKFIILVMRQKAIIIVVNSASSTSLISWVPLRIQEDCYQFNASKCKYMCI